MQEDNKTLASPDQPADQNPLFQSLRVIGFDPSKHGTHDKVGLVIGVTDLEAGVLTICPVSFSFDPRQVKSRSDASSISRQLIKGEYTGIAFRNKITDLITCIGLECNRIQSPGIAKSDQSSTSDEQRARGQEHTA